MNLYRYASRGRTPRPAHPFDRLASARYALIGGVQQTPVSRRARARPKPPRRRRAEGASPVTPPQSTRCLRRPTARIFLTPSGFLLTRPRRRPIFLPPGTRGALAVVTTGVRDGQHRSSSATNRRRRAPEARAGGGLAAPGPGVAAPSPRAAATGAPLVLATGFASGTEVPESGGVHALRLFLLAVPAA